MSKKSPKIAALIEQRLGCRTDPHYLGYFDCFNSQLFFEAHEVLEELWLTDRHGRLGDFYKGLIQLTGAFVHVQKKRQGPAAALFKLAELNLAKYAPTHEHLNVTAVLSLIREWQGQLERRDDGDLVLTADSAPRIVPADSAYVRA